jgi:putative oxidoreductase
MSNSQSPAWVTASVLIARVILIGMFAMAVAFKLMSPSATAGFIASAGFPAPMLLAWLAIIFELALVASLITGLWYSETTLLGAVYVVFLAFAFHGSSHWTDDKGLEFGAFMSHFPFAAAMLYAAAYGAGDFAFKSNSLLRRTN